MALLWQGAFFPLQYIFLLIIPFAAFALSKRPLRITLNTVLLVGLVLVMLASLLIAAKAPQIALREWLRYLLLPLYLLFFVTMQDKSAWYMRAFFGGIFWVALLGLISYMGGFIIPAGVIEQSGRLQSTIQYANTTALLMLIGALYSAEYFVTTKKWRYPVYAAGFFCCLYLTGSRTTFVLFFFILVLLVLSRMQRKMRLMAIGGITTALIGIIIAGGRVIRLSLTEPTLIERVITWQDGLSLAGQNPLFGLGIGNWQFEQFLYQSAPYGVRYVHNYYVQLMLDGGILAALLFGAVVLMCLWRGWKERNIHYYVVLAIVVHVLLDFDLAYGSVILILMFSLAQLPDRELTLFSCPNKPWRWIALLPAIVFLAMWVAEPNYIAPDPLGAKYTEARQLSSAEQYLPAIEKTEELLYLWRYNENYQAFYSELLTKAVDSGALTSDVRQQKLKTMEQNKAKVNPLYEKYIGNN